MCPAQYLILLLGAFSLEWSSSDALPQSRPPYRRVRLFSNAPIQAPPGYNAFSNNSQLAPTIPSARLQENPKVERMYVQTTPKPHTYPAYTYPSPTQATPRLREEVEEQSDYEYIDFEDIEDEFVNERRRPVDLPQLETERGRVIRPVYASYPTYVNAPQAAKVRPAQTYYAEVGENKNNDQAQAYASLFDAQNPIAEQAEWIRQMELRKRIAQATLAPPTMPPTTTTTSTTTTTTTTPAPVTISQLKTVLMNPHQFDSLFDQEEFKQKRQKYRLVNIADSRKTEERIQPKLQKMYETTTARSPFKTQNEQRYLDYGPRPVTKQAESFTESNRYYRPELKTQGEQRYQDYVPPAPVTKQAEFFTESNRYYRPELKTQGEQRYKDYVPSAPVTKQAEPITESNRYYKSDLKTLDEQRYQDYVPPAPVTKQAEPITESNRYYKSDLKTPDEQRYQDYGPPPVTKQAEPITESNRYYTPDLKTQDEQRYQDYTSRPVVKQAKRVRMSNRRHKPDLKTQDEQRYRDYRPQPVTKQVESITQSSIHYRPRTEEKTDETEPPINANYQFSTFLDDGLKDSLQQRQESSKDGQVTGMYSYSDGFFRHTVRYRADDTGYNVLSETHEPIGEGPLEDDEGVAKIQTSFNGEESKYTVDAKEIKGTRYVSHL